MRELFILILHLITIFIRLAKPGGLRAIVAESVLAKHQLLIVNRSRRRAPNLRIWDRLIAGFCSLWIQPSRFRRVAILFKPSTLLSFHRALVLRKYRLLFSPKQRTKPGPKGPAADLIRAVVEMKNAIQLGDAPKLPIRSTWHSEPLLIRMWFAGFSPSTTDRERMTTVRHG